MTLDHQPFYEGQFLLVRFGSHGKQRAEVLRDCRPHESRVRVRKFRWKSARWTKPAWITRADVVSATT